MSLEGITICGADDSIGVHMLPLLSRTYPFIEFGILMSRDRVGTPRYPSLGWIDKVCRYYDKYRGFGLSMHLCGEMARVTAGGDPAYLLACNYQAFRRVQFNRVTQIGNAFPTLVQQFHEVEFIMQTPTVDLLEVYAGLSEYCRPGKLGALFDPSGGRGIFAGAFPRTTPRALHVGFAGGIGPDNILEVITRLGERPQPYWLCMERSVRNKDDEFDVQKVEAVARVVSEHLAGRLRTMGRQALA